jgi:toxin FitB
MFLLDTKVISELRRPEKAISNVLAWASSAPAARFFLSAISILELELSLLQAARGGAAGGAILGKWIDDQVLPRFDGRILTGDTAVAQRCARFHVPDPRSRDALIATRRWFTAWRASPALSETSNPLVLFCSILECAGKLK